MSATFPETVDAWRMVQARRHFEGSIPLAAMPRLRGNLAATKGAADFQIEFGKDDFGVAHLHARIEAGLPLTCQRTLETFVLPVRVDARLGLITLFFTQHLGPYLHGGEKAVAAFDSASRALVP